jgi:hypothetical protein
MIRMKREHEIERVQEEENAGGRECRRKKVKQGTREHEKESAGGREC